MDALDSKPSTQRGAEEGIPALCTTNRGALRQDSNGLVGADDRARAIAGTAGSQSCRGERPVSIRAANWIGEGRRMIVWMDKGSKADGRRETDGSSLGERVSVELDTQNEAGTGTGARWAPRSQAWRLP